MPALPFAGFVPTARVQEICFGLFLVLTEEAEQLSIRFFIETDYEIFAATKGSERTEARGRVA